jgi:Predicted hydrolase (metallo-beta-lactamase superfamily)
VDVKSLVAKLEDKKLTDEKRKELEAKLENAIVKARKALEVDIAKSCHHGSADFSTEFLRAVNPIATIISSGDDEPYAHPRPDTLGTIGKHSRGKRSLIFSTELARSGKEFVEVAKLKDSDKKLERVVTVYGMINVRADGEKAIIAQKLEKVVGKTNWDIHKLEWNADEGAFEYIQD